MTLLVKSKTRGKLVLRPTFEGQRDRVHISVDGSISLLKGTPMELEIGLSRLNQQSRLWHGLPAMTLPQIRQGIAMILREAFQCGTRSHMLEERQKRLRRNELARFYHWKQRNRLAPLNLHKRPF